MAIAVIGKLPGQGDFIARRLSPAIERLWMDHWQACLMDARRLAAPKGLSGGEADPAVVADTSFEDRYQALGSWRALWMPTATVKLAAVWRPSHDKVGRLFPLTALMPVPAETQPAQLAAGAGSAWMAQLAGCLDRAIADSMPIERLTELLDGLDPLPDLSADHGPVLPGPLDQGQHRLRLDGQDTPLILALRSVMKAKNCWWRDGNLNGIRVLTVDGLPSSDDFHWMLG